MTKKQFIALADTIKEANKYGDRFHVAFPCDAIEFLARFCAAQNPRFNKQRWLDYIAGKCGPNGGAVK